MYEPDPNLCINASSLSIRMPCSVYSVSTITSSLSVRTRSSMCSILVDKTLSSKEAFPITISARRSSLKRATFGWAPSTVRSSCTMQRSLSWWRTSRKSWAILSTSLAYTLTPVTWLLAVSTGRPRWCSPQRALKQSGKPSQTRASPPWTSQKTAPWPWHGVRPSVFGGNVRSRTKSQWLSAAYRYRQVVHVSLVIPSPITSPVRQLFHRFQTRLELLLSRLSQLTLSYPIKRILVCLHCPRKSFAKPVVHEGGCHFH
ncbi:hypothetical protein RvY_12781-2 [Ramazzottius varieornatus]|uniref:Uncharacterized protein n=1 Tax=Ramazzottius varieornatus TaxID=947166 RepID=A0A1D1VKN5_RAMVA|nr:hypothetical protein RvY_12781-2 [Ramazzottius varieornatus]